MGEAHSNGWSASRAASRICSLTGVFCRDAAEQWEPDEARVSRPVLRERGGETPPRHSPECLRSDAALGRAGHDLAAQAVHQAEAPRQRDQEQGDARHGIEVPRLLVLDRHRKDDPAARGVTGHRAHEGARAGADPAQCRTKTRADVQTARKFTVGLERLLPARTDTEGVRRSLRLGSPSFAGSTAQALEAWSGHLPRNDCSRNVTPRSQTSGCQCPQMVVQLRQRAPRRTAKPLLRQVGDSPPCQLTSTHRTARCGPACRVVWQGTWSLNSTPLCRFAHPTNLVRRLLALVRLNVVAMGHAGIKLARAAERLLRSLDHLAPLADPSDGADDRKQYGEHPGRKTHRLQCDARIETDIRIELAVDEILIVQRD